MAEPPAKRRRRPDSAAMWEANNSKSQSSDRDRHPRETPREDGRRGERRHRSRSRDRHERRERSRERDRERDKGRDRDRDRDRDRGRDRGYGPRDEARRSRSPHRDGTNGVRTRSPPRGPRDRPRNNPPPSKPSSGPTQPSSRAPPSKIPAPTAPATTSQPDNVPNGTRAEDGEDDWEVQMRRTMGFASFRSTKNTKVPGNDKNYGVRKEKKTEYRQYMNRVGGFNRPLSPG